MMKKALFLLLLFGVAAGFAAPPPPQRFAVVRMDVLFRRYYRSKIAEEELNRQSEIYRNYLTERNKELKKLEQEIASLREEAQNIALTEEYRRGREAECIAKERDLAEQAAELRRYANDRAARLRQLEETRRNEIISEIRSAVSRKALAENYDFVFDVSGNTANNVPAVIVWPQAVDLTESVLEALNALSDKPAPAAPAAPAAEPAKPAQPAPASEQK